MEDISPEQFQQFINDFFHAVTIDKTGETIKTFFKNQKGQIVSPNGQAFGFKDHQQLHSIWKNEIHTLGTFTLVKINEDPIRIRATGTVYWQATYNDKASLMGTIKAVAGEDWIIERLENDRLQFIQYHTTFIQLLPDSADIVPL